MKHRRARPQVARRRAAPPVKLLDQAVLGGPPRQAEPLGVAGQMLVAWLKAHATRIDQLQDEVAKQVLGASESGVSWEVIGWSLGMSGEAARHRWGFQQTSHLPGSALSS
jgi:hypothetical protein